MENSDNEVEEDEVEWKSSLADITPASPASDSVSSPNKKQPTITPHRVILHFDMDCFYAQVEMIRDPTLRHVPLGIQQKYIIVTCNYVAREQGLTKLMSVTDAKEKCPQLVLVNGEDLTHYREMSYKVTALLNSYCPLVERLGFDENFMDITEMVERRLTQTPEMNNYSFHGHVYNHLSGDARAFDHQSLAVGSHIAAELREAIHSKLGLTCCAGIANNKLLAKLVSGTFKPNQQTTLLPHNIADVMGCLSGLRKVPGVGHQTAKRLQALGLVSVQDLQLFPLADLVIEFGGSIAQRLKNLALGIDESPVNTTGPPQSLSDEDSFKKMSSMKDVLQKLQGLLNSLVERMNNDGRQPQTFRLSIRRYSTTNKWFSRESRQCPIPNHIQQKITCGSTDDAVLHLVSMAMKLFHKMVDKSKAFHLTLINVCFTNLQARGAAADVKGSISSFFTRSTVSPRKTQLSPHDQEVPSQSADRQSMNNCFSTNSVNTQHKKAALQRQRGTLHGFFTKQSSADPVGLPQPLKESCSTVGSDSDATSHLLRSVVHLPQNIDPEVVRPLLGEIQEGLLAPALMKAPPSQLISASSPSTPADGIVAHCPPPSQLLLQSMTESQALKNRKEVRSTFFNQRVMEEAKPTSPQCSDCEFPVNVDTEVFSELPPDVQRELMCEWKQQKAVLKTPSSKKMGRTLVTKDKKPAGKCSQTNNLLKYFKPN